LNGPSGNPGWNYDFTSIGCTDANTGLFVSCGYKFDINGLTQPETNPANNGGHSHNTAPYLHPLGKVKVILPTPGLQSEHLKGSTENSFVYLSYEVPDVSGNIETELVMTVPPGWYTIWPESCDATRSSWCFDTTVDVGVRNLPPLPDSPSLYTKSRNPDPDTNHTNAVAFHGTSSALNNLTSIAIWYNWLFGRTLSINDMSLIKGGLFDVNHDYLKPHSWHRTGDSADINKLENGDCKKNKMLLISVYIVMGRNGGQIYANRQLPSLGHFLCETNNKNRIHIDL
jgi:hypothetical protein